MKKYLKFIFIIVALFSISFTLNVKAEEEEYHVVIEDDASLLLSVEKVKLKNQMKNLEQYGNVIVKTISMNQSETTEEYAKDYYRNSFESQPGLLFVIDQSKKDTYLYTNGDSYSKIDDTEKENIKALTQNIFQEENYYECTTTVLYRVKRTINPTQSIEEEINNYKLVIEDEAELFTEQDITRLQDKMTALTKYGHIALHTVPVGGNNYSSTADYAENYYHNKFSTESGTVFIIDMDKRMIYIFSDGENYNTITNSKADIITDNVYKYASNKDYYSCASTAFDQINTLLDGGKILEPMRHISNIFVAIILGFFINFLIVSSNAKIKKASAQNVLSKCDVDVKASNITGKKTGTHRVYSPQSSGGSSGGGGGGGGGHSGGGGGHSF